jgi:hypothetical protein
VRLSRRVLNNAEGMSHLVPQQRLWMYDEGAVQQLPRLRYIAVALLLMLLVLLLRPG